MLRVSWLQRGLLPTQTEAPKTTLRNTCRASPPTRQRDLPKSLRETLGNHTESIESVTVTSKPGSQHANYISTKSIHSAESYCTSGTGEGRGRPHICTAVGFLLKCATLPSSGKFIILNNSLVADNSTELSLIGSHCMVL